MKNQNGITLIALIITIIVMLILVAEKITSNGATGINAIVNQYTNAQETESNS